MIVIMVATGQDAAFDGLNEYLPIPLLPMGDRPFLQHVVEYLADQKVRRFEFVLSHLPEKIETALGDGARWGCTFHYHLLPLGADPLRLVRTIAADLDDVVVLGQATCLPAFDLATTPATTLISGEEAQGSPVWTGWGVFNPRDLSLPDFDSLPSIQTGHCLSIATGQDFLISQRQVLEQAFPGLLISGRQADPGIWISRNVAIHPTARLTAPLYIGENCRIGRGTQIGPGTVVGPNCIIDTHTIVTDSTVAAGTYVGEGLELDGVIVDRNRLLNIRLGTSLLASEMFLLGSLAGRTSGRVPERVLSIVVAVLLLVILWPVLILTSLWLYLKRRGSLVSGEAVQIPADNDPVAWRDSGVLQFEVSGRYGKAGEFLYKFVPGLISVLMGDVFLVGVEPRSRRQLLALPRDWRSLYLRTKAGLITEAAVMFGDHPLEDELYTAEAFYSATESVSHDGKLAGLWLWKLLAGSNKAAKDLANESTT